MKFRFAVVIAMVLIAGCVLPSAKPSPSAWLLLAPPLGANGKVDTSQPLSKWQDIEDFASQADCDSSLTQQQFGVHKAYGPVTEASAQSYSQIQALQTLKSQCVARSDPRLDPADNDLRYRVQPALTPPRRF